MKYNLTSGPRLAYSLIMVSPRVRILTANRKRDRKSPLVVRLEGEKACEKLYTTDIQTCYMPLKSQLLSARSKGRKLLQDPYFSLEEQIDFNMYTAKTNFAELFSVECVQIGRLFLSLEVNKNHFFLGFRWNYQAHISKYSNSCLKGILNRMNLLKISTRICVLHKSDLGFWKAYSYILPQ